MSMSYLSTLDCPTDLAQAFFASYIGFRNFESEESSSSSESNPASKRNRFDSYK